MPPSDDNDRTQSRVKVALGGPLSPLDPYPPIKTASNPYPWDRGGIGVTPIRLLPCVLHILKLETIETHHSKPVSLGLITLDLAMHLS